MANKKDDGNKISKKTNASSSNKKNNKKSATTNVEKKEILDVEKTIENASEDNTLKDSKNVADVKVEDVPLVQTSKSQTDYSNQGKNASFIEKNKGLLVLGGIAVAGIILFIIFIGIILSIFNNKGKNVEQPLVYLTDDGTLKYITSNKKEGIVISENFDNTMNVKYSNTSTRYILYVRNNNLYLLDTTKNKDAEKIANDVSNFEFSLDDKYIVYTNENGNLYVNNFKDKEKIDSDISSILEISKDKVFYKKDGNIYMKSLNSIKEEKVKIVSDVKNIYFNEEITKILYSKKNDDDSYDYYVYDVKSKKENKVLSDVYAIYNYNKDFTKFIYGVKNDQVKYDLSQIVDDDKKDSDLNFVEHSYSEYLNGDIDYDTWRKSLSEKYDVESRNKIREQLKEEFKLDSGYAIYYKSGNKEIQLVENASKVLYSDADSMRVAYTTVKYDTNEKIKLSEVSYFYKIKNYLKEHARNTLMFKVGQKDPSEIVDNLDSNIYVYVIKNDLYYLLNKNLSYAKINGNKVDNSKVIAENVTILNSNGDYNDSLVFLTDVKNSVGDLKIAKSGNVSLVATDVYTSGLEISDSKKIYFYTDYKNSSGDYNVYNGKVTKLFTDVSAVKYVNDNYMYVLKDYSSKSKTSDLYRYRGKKELELIDYSIKKAN